MGVTQLRIDLSQLSQAIVWLSDRGIDSGRLARWFDTTSGHIRVLSHRNRAAKSVPILSRIDAAPPFTARRAFGLRVQRDDVVPSARSKKNADWLAERIATVVSSHQASYTFLEGAAALQRLDQFAGWPAGVRFIRLRAQIRQQMAWFFSHSGLGASAIRESRRAMSLWRIAHQESESPADLLGLGKSTLIASNSRLLRSEPDAGLALLDIADDAIRGAGQALGSDHYRQRGVALFQKSLNGSLDQQARRMFDQAMLVMEAKHEARYPVEVRMTGDRHSFLLGDIRWEKSQDLLAECRKTFGATSLEASMAAHWSAAAGLTVDSPTANTAALELIHANHETVAHFGHQATIAKLLLIAPELPKPLRSSWIRLALYQNAFRNR